MTETKPTGRALAAWRGKLLIALFAATAALPGGTQALAPAPVAAAMSDGAPCDPNTPPDSSDCEPDRGGGGSNGGGDTGGGGEISGSGDSTDGSGEAGSPGDPETIGEETIEVESTVPNQPACRQGSLCLPSHHDRQGPGSDRGENPHGPRHRGKPVTVAEAPTKSLSRDDCRRLKGAELAMSASTGAAWDEAKEKIDDLYARWQGLSDLAQAMKREEDSGTRDLSALEAAPEPDYELIWVRVRKLNSVKYLRKVTELQVDLFYDRYLAAKRERNRMEATIRAETQAAQAECKRLYGISP